MEHSLYLSQNPFLKGSEAPGFHSDASLSHPLGRNFFLRALLDTGDLKESPVPSSPAPSGVVQL